jgi:peptidoglycan-N-acetylglucosamine deacetylase
MTRPVATLSLDLDDLWSYLKVRDDAAWQSYPTYLPQFVPLLTDLLDEVDRTITVFVVGTDAERPEVIPLLQGLAERGHELANHSYTHDSWLRSYPAVRLAEEIDRTDQAIERATGRRPIGFRGPGFAWNAELLELLAARGYQYDASTFPTFLSPLARAYYFRKARLSAEERARRRSLYGSWQDGLLPIGAYRWQLDGGRSLLEIPVTTVPGLRTPFHMSYLLYLSRYSIRLMESYLRTALLACRARGVAPSFLLHPTDFIDVEMAPGLEFFPGMDLSVDHKLNVLRRALSLLTDRFEVTTLGSYSRSVSDGKRLALREPNRASVEPAARQHEEMSHASA